jgi:hypothetical protein
MKGRNWQLEIDIKQVSVSGLMLLEKFVWQIVYRRYPQLR